MSLVHPILFSTNFGVAPSELARAGLLDPILNADTKLFIDPLLVARSNNPAIKSKGRRALDNGFKTVIRLADISKADGDASFKGAVKALNLDERPETSLGYGGASTRGSSRPASLRRTIVRTTKEILSLGEKDPAMIPLMAVFEDGVGPDTLSDLTTNYLLPVLCELTEAFCTKQGVKVSPFGARYGNCSLPANPYRIGEPVVLVPRDLLRDLPLAADWSDVSAAVFEIREIRDQVNAMVGNLAKATISEKKKALRKTALRSARNIREIIEAVVNAADSYDESADLDGFYLFRDILSGDRSKFKGLIKKPARETQDTLRETVTAIIEEFTSLVEHNNLWELLWNKATPRHERAAQLLFFAIATVMCAANGVDISPETNAGGGPVDFKFSSGGTARVLVELKLSTGRVVHGYKTQLEIYKKASRTQDGMLVVINVGGIGNKLRQIQKVHDQAKARGEKVSEIFEVDGRRKRSASKR